MNFAFGDFFVFDTKKQKSRLYLLLYAMQHPQKLNGANSPKV